MRGMILCGLVRKLLNTLSQAQDLLNSKNNACKSLRIVLRICD